MQIAIVWNPSKTDKETLSAAVTAAAPDAELRWYETSEDDPGQGMAREASSASPDLILAAGGDGTVRAVAEALAEQQDSPDLGILPLGTGNLLCRNLGIPLALPDAATHAVTSAARKIDFGWVEYTGDDGSPQRHGFAVMVGFGIDANMIAETNDDLKKKAGWLAYVESIGRAVSASDVIRARVDIDGRTQETDAHTIIVGNCGAIQGGVTLLPDAQPDDGILDVLILSSEGMTGWFDTLKTMAWDNGLKKMLPGTSDETVSTDTTAYEQGTRVVVELPDARPFQIDGEDVGTVSRFDISLQPGALSIR